MLSNIFRAQEPIVITDDSVGVIPTIFENLLFRDIRFMFSIETTAQMFDIQKTRSISANMEDGALNSALTFLDSETYIKMQTQLAQFLNYLRSEFFGALARIQTCSPEESSRIEQRTFDLVLKAVNRFPKHMGWRFLWGDCMETDVFRIICNQLTNSQSTLQRAVDGAFCFFGTNGMKFSSFHGFGACYAIQKPFMDNVSTRMEGIPDGSVKQMMLEGISHNLLDPFRGAFSRFAVINNEGAWYLLQLLGGVAGNDIFISKDGVKKKLAIRLGETDPTNRMQAKIDALTHFGPDAGKVIDTLYALYDGGIE